MPTLALCAIVGTRLSRTVGGWGGLSHCDFPRSEAEGISGGDQCLCGNESGLGGDCGAHHPTQFSTGSGHALSAHLPGSLDSPLTSRSLVWVSVARTTATSGSGDCATVRQVWAQEALPAQCLTVAPGNSHFRERAPIFLLTGLTREPEFPGSATGQQLVSLLYRTGWPLGPAGLLFPACRPTPRRGLRRSYGGAAREERRREPVLAAGAREH